MTRTTVDHNTRFGIEYRAPKATEWILLGTVGSAGQAESWCLRFAASGTFRVRKPQQETQHVRR